MSQRPGRRHGEVALPAGSVRELARVDPASADGARVWASYLTSWTAWNHVRTVAALAAAALLTLSWK